MLGHLGIIGEAAINGETRGRTGNALYGAYGQDFLCADGRRVMVIGLTDRQWRGLLKATDSTEAMAALAARLGADFRDEGARFAHRHAITGILKPWFAARRVAEFGPAFDAAGVTWSEFRSFMEALESDPDLSPDNPMFRLLDQPGIGRYLVPGSPLDASRSGRPDPAPAPRLGEHTEQILADVARLPETEIAALFDAGIVRQAGRRIRMAS
jgi:2-methylfumaryl-CoA isomerase